MGCALGVCWACQERVGMYKWWARAVFGMGRSVFSRWIKRRTGPSALKLGVAYRLLIQVQVAAHGQRVQMVVGHEMWPSAEQLRTRIGIY